MVRGDCGKWVRDLRLILVGTIEVVRQVLSLIFEQHAMASHDIMTTWQLLTLLSFL